MDRLLEATHRAQQAHFWFRGFRAFVRPLVARAVAGVARPRILDCGCGTGSNMRLLSEYGHTSGFDLTWRGLELARSQGPMRLAQASITRIPFPAATFDLVTSFDVLYSLTAGDEAAAVAEMHRVLRPGGAAIVNTAAMEILRGTHSVLSQEVRRSNRSQLRQRFTAAGFEIERLTYTNFSLFPLMVVVRAIQRGLGLPPEADAETDIAVPAAPVNALLSGLLSLEARALRVVDLPAGSSLLCLARKPAHALQ
jgi:SAM-dependent methyltransferase